jgi:hypothetical protein
MLPACRSGAALGGQITQDFPLSIEEACALKTSLYLKQAAMVLYAFAELHWLTSPSLSSSALSHGDCNIVCPD